MANRFKQAAPIASRLYKSGRYKTYADAMKAALKKTPKRKSVSSVGKVKKKRVVRNKAKDAKGIHKHWAKVPAHERRVSNIGSVPAGTLKGELKQRIKGTIDKAVLGKFHAKKKSDKKYYQKIITQKKTELRRLS